MAISKPKNSDLFDDLVLNFDPFSLNGLDQFGMSSEDLSRSPSGAASVGGGTTAMASGNATSNHPTGLGPDRGPIGALPTPDGATLPTVPAAHRGGLVRMAVRSGLCPRPMA